MFVPRENRSFRARAGLRVMDCALRQEPLRQLLEHDAVALRGEMIVAQDVEVFVPILVGIAGGEERREQIDEGLAVSRAEVAP
jgi:hypothetical protein